VARRRCRGQATVELALTLPFVATLLLAVVQVLLVAHGQLLVEHDARQAARAAAVGARPAAGPGPAGEPSTVEVRDLDGGLVEVTVRRRFATDVPIVGALTPDLELIGRAAFRREDVVPEPVPG
jgi:hypothetical protein